LADQKLSHQYLVKESEKDYKRNLEKDKKDFEKYSIEDLKKIVSIRKSSF